MRIRGGNAANTGASLDRFVKPPLSRLWFDGSLRWIRTHGSTAVRVVGGRVIVHANKLYAIDVFTGRHLWQADSPNARPTDDGMAARSLHRNAFRGEWNYALHPRES